MTDERDDDSVSAIDLSSLDPRGEPARMDVLIDRIVVDGMAARSARARADSLSAQLVRWSRPALLAASAVLAVALPVAIRAGRELSQRMAESQVPAVPSSRLGLPIEVVALTQSGRSPTVAEIAAAFNERQAEGER